MKCINTNNILATNKMHLSKFVIKMHQQYKIKIAPYYYIDRVACRCYLECFYV